MSVYKCICCGEMKESKQPCSCSVCGYRMFEGDYDRSTKLKEEIVSFVSKLRLSEKDGYCLTYRREELAGDGTSKKKIISKHQDDQRFPVLNTIQKYVRYVDKTETFAMRSKDTVRAIQDHISSQYEKEYYVSYDKMYTMIGAYNAILAKALPMLRITLEIPEIKFPDVTVKYEETPEEEFLPIVNEIADTLLALCEKVQVFIKVNNLYGDTYKKGYEIEPELTKDKNYLLDLERACSIVKRAVEKKYVVDIFDDGSAELEEMLSAYWYAVKTLLAVPIHKKRYTYTLADGTSYVDNDFHKQLSSILDEAYYPHRDVVLYLNTPLSDMDEKALFEVYNKMIEIDTMNIMGVNKSNLLRIGESEERLNQLIGLDSIKESVKKLKAYVVSNKENANINLHMCFYGNPGTGKTEVARIIAGILYENKILPTNKVVEVSREDLVGEYIGETPQKTAYVIRRAMGGVLFIDEAYSLVPAGNTFDYGYEAVATLIKAMEDHRGKFCVILAGYKNEMLKMLNSNPGFKSRIQFELDFPNYTREELGAIADSMLVNRGYDMSDSARSRMLDVTDMKRKDANFANAREVRNILDQVIMCQNLRALSDQDKEIGIVDVEKYIKDAKIKLVFADDGAGKKILTADQELDALVGLDTVKRMVKKIRAYAKRNRDLDNFNIHMCFYGNPGTGKTEVARIISRVLYDAGVLEEAKLIETDAHGLIGRFVGETAPKTEEKIQSAMGGVLFIDEAYSLYDGDMGNSSSIGYGDEAISVLLKQMEDYRGKFCVVLAGYRAPMQRMLASNPGLESRVQFTLEFPDYTKDELCEIAQRFAEKKGYSFEEDALKCFSKVVEHYRQKPNFANARTVRNVLDQVIMNQNLRTEDATDNHMIELEDIEDYILDEKIKFGATTNRIGF